MGRVTTLLFIKQILQFFIQIKTFYLWRVYTTGNYIALVFEFTNKEYSLKVNSNLSDIMACDINFKIFFETYLIYPLLIKYYSYLKYDYSFKYVHTKMGLKSHFPIPGDFIFEYALRYRKVWTMWELRRFFIQVSLGTRRANYWRK